MSVPGSGAPVRPSVTYPRTEWDRGGGGESGGGRHGVADGPVDPRVHRVRVQGEVVPLDLARVDREGVVAEGIVAESALRGGLVVPGDEGHLVVSGGVQGARVAVSGRHVPRRRRELPE